MFCEEYEIPAKAKDESTFDLLEKFNDDMPDVVEDTLRCPPKIYEDFNNPGTSPHFFHEATPLLQKFKLLSTLNLH